MTTVILAELTWPEVKELLATRQVDTAVIALGATEQHGHHLPLGTDALLAQALGEEVARRLGRALLAPPLVVGRSEHHLAFPGTITVRQETLAALLEDYVASLERHGFANVVLVPTHGGNFRPLAAIARSLRSAHPRLNFVEYTDLDRFIAMLYAAAAEFGVSPAVAGAHSGELETSLMLALWPDLVRLASARPGYLGPQDNLADTLFARGIGAIDAGGVLGDPRLGTAEKGRVYLERFVADVVAFVRPALK
ncbi:MAG: creatininase family protein [Chloroflexota bacterium]